MSTDLTRSPEPWKVKLYQLHSDGSWFDKGTGFADCKTLVMITT